MSNDFTNWIAAAGSFDAHIHCYGVTKYWDGLSNDWKEFQFFWDGAPSLPPSPVRLSKGPDINEGWLITGAGGTATPFNITFDSQTTNRLHVRIKGTGGDSNRQVEISRNGYLGLYRGDSNVDVLKLEPLEWTENTLTCRIRDHLGHTVKIAYEWQVYLNVQAGEDATFIITRQQ